MLRTRLLNPNAFVRYASQEGKIRFMRTVPAASRSPAADFGRLNQQIPADLPNNEFAGRSWAKHSIDSPLTAQSQSQTESPSPASSRWSKHSLDTSPGAASNSKPQPVFPGEISIISPVRRSRTSRFKSARTSDKEPAQLETAPAPDASTHKPNSIDQNTSQASELPKVAIETPAPETVQSVPVQETPVKAKKPRRQLKPRKALIRLTPNALENLRALLDQPEPQLIRIGVKNRGCSGLTYHLEYVSEPGKFDEIVEQDGVRVVIDSKALFSIVGSEMDWIDDKLSSRFIFRNPNSKGTCGCGESFMV